MFQSAAITDKKSLRRSGRNLRTRLQNLRTHLRNTSPATLGDIDSVDGKAKIVAAIKVARCADDSENPLEPVITGAISVSLQGSISKARGGTGSVSATPSLAYAYKGPTTAGDCANYLRTAKNAAGFLPWSKFGKLQWDERQRQETFRG
jgi:hypothetical protein